MIVALYHGSSPLSLAVRARSWSDDSHLSLLDDAPCEPGSAHYLSMVRDLWDVLDLYEAWIPNGVVHRESFHEGHRPGTDVDLFFVHVPSPEETIQFLRGQLGAKYDYRGALGFMTRRDRAHHPDKWFCSELGFAALNAGGATLLVRIPFHRCFPCYARYAPSLVYIGTVRSGNPESYRYRADLVSTETFSLGHVGLAGKRTRMPQDAIDENPLPHPRESSRFDLQTHSGDLQGVSAPCAGFSPEPALFSAANEAKRTATAPLAAANAVAESGAFVVRQADSLFVPFGTYWHDSIGWQEFDAASANELLSGVRESVGGIPIYVGHPDLPGSDQRWPDKAAKGRVRGGRLGEYEGAPGAIFEVAYNAKGRELIAGAEYNFYSPFWDLRHVGTRDGARLCRPFRLRSIGLVNESNIPVPPIANESQVSATQTAAAGSPSAAQQQGGIRMDPRILEALGLAEGATIEQVLEAIAAQKQAAAAAAEAKTAAEIATANEKARADREALAAANERKARVTLVVDANVAAGKMLEADRARWTQDLEADFAAANERLSRIALPAAESRTKGLGARAASAKSGESGAAREKFLSAVNEAKVSLRAGGVTNESELHNRAWAQCKRSHSEVYAAMTAKQEA